MTTLMSRKIWSKLYKIDNIGNTRVWWIEATQKLDGSYYTQFHGIDGGKIQETSTLITSGKNFGKANETTAWEQCCAEAQSLWNKQKDRKGYTLQRQSDKPFGPMLAKDYNKDGKHIEFPCCVQPKLDGIKCLAHVQDGKVRLISRQNTVFTSLTNLEKQVSKLANGIYDGELYIHGETFQNIVGAIKRDEPNALTDKIEYHIYDVVNTQHTFINRYSCLVALDRALNPTTDEATGEKLAPFLDLPNIKVVPTYEARDITHVEKYHKNFTQKGYEGVMLRNNDGKYKLSGRSKDLQKYKKFIDEEFEIIDAEENKGKLAGTCVFVCTTKDDGIFKCMPEGTEEQRRRYWQDWNNGKIKKGDLATVRFFSWTTSKNKVPRFPILLCVRNYET